MERQGSGLKNICDETEAAANYVDEFKPEFYSDHGQFRVTLWNMNYNSDVTQDVTRDERKNQILNAIKKNKNIRDIYRNINGL